MQLESVLRAPSARRALRRRSRRRDRAADRRRRPRRAARRARPRELRARRPAGGRARRPGGDRRRVGAGPARRPGRRRPRLGQRGADAVRAERRAPARRARRGRHRLSAPRSARGCRSRPPSPPARSRWSASLGPRHPVSQQTAIFLTDAEAARLAGHPGRVDAIGVLAGPGFDASRLRAAAGGAQVLTGDARGQAEHPELQQARTTLIPVTAAFGGLALFIAMFVVASTMGLSIQQREREIALLRAVAATPGQIRRMIAWEAAIVGLVGSAAGVWPGMRARRGARTCARAPRHRAAELHRRRRLDAGRGRHRRRSRDRAARRPGRRAARRPRAADARAHRRRGRAAAARARPRRSAGCSRSPARCRCSGLHHHQRPGDGRGDVGDDRDLARGGGRLPRTDRGARRPPGSSDRRSRRSRPSAGSSRPRTSAPPRDASRRPARRWCSRSP